MEFNSRAEIQEKWHIWREQGKLGSLNYKNSTKMEKFEGDILRQRNTKRDKQNSQTKQTNQIYSKSNTFKR